MSLILSPPDDASSRTLGPNEAEFTIFGELRLTEYGRVDATGQVYLEDSGVGLHAQSQLDAHVDLLRNGVVEQANHERISLRTGCFCNPGAGEIAHGLGAHDVRRRFERDEPLSFNDLREHLRTEFDVLVAAIHVSVGVPSSFGDVHHFLEFMREFVDRSIDDLGHLELASAQCRVVRDSA